jgi:hypothetical protein
MDTTAPPISLLAALQDELADYERQRAAFARKTGVHPQYRAGIDGMWAWAISVKRGQIEKERSEGDY